MGEVYQARDTRLQRIVAVKTLPEALASDRDRLEPFKQEARISRGANCKRIGSSAREEHYSS